MFWHLGHQHWMQLVDFVGLRQYVRTSMIRARLAKKNFIISGWQTVDKIFLSAISTCLSFAVYLNSEPESSKTFFSVTVERGKQFSESSPHSTTRSKFGFLEGKVL
jgi:hypothetical protein